VRFEIVIRRTDLDHRITFVARAADFHRTGGARCQSKTDTIAQTPRLATVARSSTRQPFGDHND
jgi:hypothetical protein